MLICCPMSSYEDIVSEYIQTVRLNRYIPHEPTEKQAFFLLHAHSPEILYGGSAGGGKSDSLLMAALQYVHVPDYAALLLRRTYKELALPEAIMDRAHEWLTPTDAKWHEDSKTWEFPSGATLTFGYLEGPRDHYRYQSSAYQFVGFDELTQFQEVQYRYLFSRLRRLAGSDIPLRMRAASNPGGVGHEWVYHRFIDPETRGDRIFIPAKLGDNKYLDQAEYIASLNKLDPITREQLLNGDWNVRPEGGIFRREWLNLVSAIPASAMLKCRFWDKAATQDGGDYTAGALVGILNGQVYILDIQRVQLSPGGVEKLIYQTAMLDGPEVMIRMEQEPGSSGVDVIDHYTRYVLAGYNFKGVKSTGSKVARATPLSTMAESGNLFILARPWTEPLINELVLFPAGPHDDQVDAVSGAFNALTLGMQENYILVYDDDDYQISPI